MQNRYVGDVGDYAKYSLLRRLCRVDGQRPPGLAVVWCLFPDEKLNRDGKHVSYLKDPRFARLDPNLYATLKSIVFHRERCVSAIADSGCLPSSAVFFSEPISPGGGAQVTLADRIRCRDAWLSACIERTQKCQLVFFDPDNGLETKSVPRHHPKAGKYIYWSELIPFWCRGNALLIYHHLNRSATAARQVQALSLRFSAALERAAVVPLVFRRGSSRVFWLVHHADELGRELEARAAHMLSGGWFQHFRPFGWPAGP